MGIFNWKWYGKNDTSTQIKDMGIFNWKWYGKNDMGTQLKIWVSLIENDIGKMIWVLN